MMSCNKNAITIKNGQAIINEEKCVNCGLCQKACPYHAIIYTPVPCEESCPVNAIKKNGEGKERINKEDCIYCGKCIESCPFGAIVEKSHVYHVIDEIKQGNNLVAMVAPALMGQFRGNIRDIIDSVKKLGFDKVIEVAEGANMTTQNEAAEWMHKINEGQSFMTTSCCPGYVNLVDKHIAELKPFVSETKSPMVYTAEMVKKEFPGVKTVFIGPCLAKKQEATMHKIIDYVINFEELGAWFLASNINVFGKKSDLERNIAKKESRTYAYAGGVTNAVKAYIPVSEGLKPELIQGLNKQTIRLMKNIPKKTQEFNFLEVMSCENGCIGGCSNIAKVPAAKRQIDKNAEACNFKLTVT
jgi:[FeFe] hydrogenase (group B1/B3)